MSRLAPRFSRYCSTSVCCQCRYPNEVLYSHASYWPLPGQPSSSSLPDRPRWRCHQRGTGYEIRLLEELESLTGSTESDSSVSIGRGSLDPEATAFDILVDGRKTGCGGRGPVGLMGESELATAQHLLWGPVRHSGIGWAGSWPVLVFKGV